MSRVHCQCGNIASVTNLDRVYWCNACQKGFRIVATGAGDSISAPSDLEFTSTDVSPTNWQAYTAFACLVALLALGAGIYVIRFNAGWASIPVPASNVPSDRAVSATADQRNSSPHSSSVPIGKADEKPRTPVSLPTGTELVAPPSTKGMGMLEVLNENDEDAVVKLVNADDPNTIVRCVYVRRGTTLRLGGITDGMYRLLFTMGLDWDRAQMHFRRDPKYVAFDDELYFESDGTRYRRIMVTLHSVPDGTASTSPISEDQFGPAYPQ